MYFGDPKAAMTIGFIEPPELGHEKNTAELPSTEGRLSQKNMEKT